MHASNTLVYANLFNIIYVNKLTITSKSFTLSLLMPFVATVSPVNPMSVAFMRSS